MPTGEDILIESRSPHKEMAESRYEATTSNAKMQINKLSWHKGKRLLELEKKGGIHLPSQHTNERTLHKKTMQSLFVQCLFDGCQVAISLYFGWIDSKEKKLLRTFGKHLQDQEFVVVAKLLQEILARRL